MIKKLIVFLTFLSLTSLSICQTDSIWIDVRILDSCLVASEQRDNLLEERELNLNKIIHLRAIMTLQEEYIKTDSLHIQYLNSSIKTRDEIIAEQKKLLRRKSIALWTGTLGTTLIMGGILVPVLLLK